MSENKVRKVVCPRCGNEALFSPENPFRPFCSERCRLIDLGSWASESYRVPSQESGSVQDPPQGDESEGQD